MPSDRGCNTLMKIMPNLQYLHNQYLYLNAAFKESKYKTRRSIFDNYTMR